nr:uncharacterized protein LOC116428123 isoform X1 [Nomia melanderi]XP_031835193.1 uncharacterized protein LOC116428123 isoform X1 [Nomia melanderi]
MDPENVGKETILKVTDWLRGIWEMRRKTGPVQQWVDSLPSPAKSNLSMENQHQDGPFGKVTVSLPPTEPKDIPYSMEVKSPKMTISAPINVPNMSIINASAQPSSLPHKLMRDPSLQSDSSHCSSVESLLELRKADPEAVLLGLGFGGSSSSPQDNGSLSRIPKRFLQPSKLKGIAINDFVKQQQETSESFDSVSLGYRGLTGSPYVAPSEIVQKIMQCLREHESHEQDPYALYNSYEQYSPLQQTSGTLSVLSPDNRQFLERPRSKSPDMRNKRMIIGQKSFAFGHDGNLIEINSSNVKRIRENNINSEPSSIGNSQIFFGTVENMNVDHSKMFEDTAIQKINNILPKKLSFDDSIEICDANINEPLETDKEYINTPNIKFDEGIDFKQHTSLNITSQNLSDIRRASDGACDMKIESDIPIVQSRRHSDSFVHTTENGNNESILSQKRRTLKRQTRVSDVDAVNYCNFNSKTRTSETMEQKVIHSQKKIDTRVHSKSTQTTSLKNITENVGLKNENDSYSMTHGSSTFAAEVSDCTRCIDNSFDEEKQNHDVDKHYDRQKNQSLNQTCIDDEESTTNCCCCRSGSTKYWEKVDKIIQENKNFENMVKKNRREMAEIREMLSNVLSVRLEPGF